MCKENFGSAGRRCTGTLAQALLLAIAISACGNGGSSGRDGGLAAGSANTLDKGFCADSCPRPCNQDNDCKTDNGELCCDFGGEGKACVDARECPRQCQSDSKCDSTHGEACVRVTLATATKVCAPAAEGLQLCQSDSSCKQTGEVCCMAFQEPLCMPANRCPKTCAQSGDCSGQEECCTTLSKLDTTLKAGGVCLAPSTASCPTACKQSSDCNTKRGELCCFGYCSDFCPTQCAISSDCRGQICCKTRAAYSPLFSGSSQPGYSRGGGTTACTPGTQSVPGSADDPCPQTGNACAQAGMLAVSTCQANGTWSLQCQCVASASAGCGFRCSTGTCVDASFRCDGVDDCPRGDDEIGCGGSSASTGCSASMGTSGCNSCCGSSNSLGAQEFLDFLTGCVCGSGPCAATCAAKAFCATPDPGAAVTSACTACLTNSCASDLARSCESSVMCMKYLSCASGC